MKTKNCKKDDKMGKKPGYDSSKKGNPVNSPMKKGSK